MYVLPLSYIVDGIMILPVKFVPNTVPFARLFVLSPIATVVLDNIVYSHNRWTNIFIVFV